MYSNITAAVVGSINMDEIFMMEKVPELGENVSGTKYSYAAGGKGANQATGLSRLGAKTRMIGKVADDINGRKLLENLKNNSIDVSGVYKNGTATGLALILIDGNGKNRIVVYEGANGELTPDEAAKFIADDIDVLLFQFEVKEDVIIRCVNEAVKKGIMTVVDSGLAKNFQLEKMQGMTIVTPNESETEALTGIFPADEKAIFEASKILHKRSRAKYVILKLGSRGCSCYDGTTLHMFPSYPAEVVDTTAAGDSFTAALALEYRRSGDIFSACDFANRAGSIAVSRVGADNSMPTAEELQNM